MTDRDYYKEKLLEMIDKLSGKAIKRLYQLAEYLYIHKGEVNTDE